MLTINKEPRKIIYWIQEGTLSLRMRKKVEVPNTFFVSV